MSPKYSSNDPVVDQPIGVKRRGDITFSGRFVDAD